MKWYWIAIYFIYGVVVSWVNRKGMKMTKSIQKASDGMVLPKVKGSNDPHYIKS